MIWMVLGGVYLTVDWVVDGDKEEQSYGAKEHDPLGDKVKLFEFCLQQGGTASWIAGTHQHCPLPWPLPCYDLIVVYDCVYRFRSICARSYVA